MTTSEKDAPPFPQDAPIPDFINGDLISSAPKIDAKAELAQSSSHLEEDSSDSLHAAAPGFLLERDENDASIWATLRATLRALRDVERDQVLREMDHLGIQSLPFLLLVLACVGAILVYQAGLQALRLVPDTSSIGPAYIELLVRDLAATLTGLMLATRVGAGIAAEIGSLKVTDQLDALRLSRADPVIFFIAPKVLASVLLTPLLTFFAGVAALLSGLVTGIVAFSIQPQTFLDARFIGLDAFLLGTLKAMSFGLLIPVLSAHAGLYCKRGSDGVGDATTQAVVRSSLAVIITGFLWGLLGQVVF